MTANFEPRHIGGDAARHLSEATLDQSPRLPRHMFRALALAVILAFVIPAAQAELRPVAPHKEAVAKDAASAVRAEPRRASVDRRAPRGADKTAMLVMLYLGQAGSVPQLAGFDH